MQQTLLNCFANEHAYNIQFHTTLINSIAFLILNCSPTIVENGVDLFNISYIAFLYILQSFYFSQVFSQVHIATN